MKTKSMWITDPKTGKKSITLTFALWSFIILLISCTLHMMEVVKTISYTFETFLSCAGLYLGRRFKIPGKVEQYVE